MRLTGIFCIILFFLFGDSVSAQINKEAPLAERKVRLSWEEVGGAVSYKVIIKDSGNDIIIDKYVDSNHIILEAIPGNYAIRIGAINKFSKISSWSEWAKISIEKPGPVHDERKKDKDEAKLSDLGLKIGIGMSYFYILPDWNTYYKNSYNAYSADIEYSLRNISFQAPFSFLRYTGFDVESNYVKFVDKKALNRVESNITVIISGFNIFLSTSFNTSLNFAIRGGGGVAYTIQEFQKYDDYGNPADKGTSRTLDPYYKIGLSAEYRFYSIFFLQINSDYYIINYLVKDFRSLRFSGLVGVKI